MLNHELIKAFQVNAPRLLAIMPDILIPAEKKECMESLDIGKHDQYPAVKGQRADDDYIGSVAGISRIE